MLIDDPRLRPGDRERWRSVSVADAVHGQIVERRCPKALQGIADFVNRKPAYCGVSWGKDSVVAADLCCRAAREFGVRIPLAWVRVEPIANPCCPAVRDAFLARWPDAEYHEIEVWCRKDESGWHASGTLEEGFRRAVSATGCVAHISGVRGQESGTRKLRMLRWGVETRNTLAPIGWWSAQDVYGYLAWRDLPVSAVYAMSGGGRWCRDRLRVSSLGGRRGDGMGRGSWEWEYWRDRLWEIADRDE